MSSVGEVVRLWYLPPEIEPGSNRGSLPTQRLRRVTPELVEAAAAVLDAHRAEIESMPVSSIVAAIDAVVRAWSAKVPHSPYALALLEHGPALTGYSRAALEYALRPMLQAI